MNGAGISRTIPQTPLALCRWWHRPMFLAPRSMNDLDSGCKRSHQPLLTIAIPTYQRFAWLKRSLNLILCQSSSVPVGHVEVLVSDNAGTDGSWAYAQALAEKHTELRIHRNETNVGAEANFRQLPDMATGKYLWLLGDDDFIEDGALAEILDLLSKDLDYLIMNITLCDEHMGGASNPFWPVTASRLLTSFDDCIQSVPHFAMGFISCWIARRELFNKIDITTYDRFKQWGLSSMLDRYMTVACSKSGWLVAYPLLKSRKPSPLEYGDRFDYFEWFFEGTAQVFDHLSKGGFIKRHTVAQRKGWLLQHTAVKRILFERSCGIIKRKRVAKILSDHYAGQWQYWLLCLPALYIPGLGAAARMFRRT